MELILEEQRQLLNPVHYFNTARLPTLTDVCIYKDTILVLAHRSAGKFYLLEFEYENGRAAVLDTIEVSQAPDLFTIYNDCIYSVNFSNTVTKIPIVANKFGSPEYIPIHDTNIYHGATTHMNKLYFTQSIGQSTEYKKKYEITTLDPETNVIEHIYPEHCWNRIKKVEFIGDTYILMLVCKNYYTYGNSTPEYPILLTDSQLLLLDTSWKTLDSLPIQYSHADSIAVQGNQFYVTVHSGFRGGFILRGSVVDGKLTDAQTMASKGFPHGITVNDTTLFYTSYETSGLYIHPLKECSWKSFHAKPWSIPQYLTPTKTDTIVLIPYFNPTKSTRLFQNLLTVRATLERASIPYKIGELAFLNEPFSLSESSTVQQFRSNSYGFYKENILNEMIATLEGYDKYIIMDGDMIFADAGWFDRVSGALDSAEVVHPFSEVTYLGFDFIPTSTLPSVVKDPTQHSSSGHVWAFRKSWWEEVDRLYEFSLIGGGDVALCMKLNISTARFSSASYINATKIKYFTRISGMEGTVYHLPHGNSSKRQYFTRNHKLADFLERNTRKTIEECVSKNEYGINEILPDLQKEWNTLLYSYFEDRNDDGI